MSSKLFLSLIWFLHSTLRKKVNPLERMQPVYYCQGVFKEVGRKSTCGVVVEETDSIEINMVREVGPLQFKLRC